MQRVGVGVGRDPEELFNLSMDLLEQGIRPVSGFIHRWDPAHISMEHSVLVLLHANRTTTLPAFDHDLDLAVVEALGLQNAAERADRIDLLGRRFIDCCVVLRGKKDQPFARHRSLERCYRTGTTDLECDFRVGKDDDIAYRYHRIQFDVRRPLVCKFLHIRGTNTLGKVQPEIPLFNG